MLSQISTSLLSPSSRDLENAQHEVKTAKKKRSDEEFRMVHLRGNSEAE
jgi:hypothetical protein